MLGFAVACAAPAATPPASAPVSTTPAAPPSTAPAASAPAATPPAPLHVVANWTQPTGSMSGIWIAQEAGLFREQGLDLELLNIPNTSRVLQTMAAGEMNLSPLDPATTVRASLGGLDVVLLYAQTNRLVFGVYAQPSIPGPQDLRGKVIGTTRIGASNHTATLVALDTWGLVPDRDVALRQLGEVPAIYAAPGRPDRRGDLRLARKPGAGAQPARTDRSGQRRPRIRLHRRRGAAGLDRRQ